MNATATATTTGKHAGVTIRAFRRALGMTQGELAERVGTSRTYLSAIETGAVTPSRRWLNRTTFTLATLTIKARRA